MYINLKLSKRYNINVPKSDHTEEVIRSFYEDVKKAKKG